MQAAISSQPSGTDTALSSRLSVVAKDRWCLVFMRMMHNVLFLIRV